MAAGCRRVCLLLSRSWTSGACALSQRTLTTSIYPQLESQRCREALCAPSVATSTATTTCLQYSTKVVGSVPSVEAGVGAEEVVEQPPGFFKRLWRWLHTEGDDVYHMSAEEREERDQLMIRLQEMYFADPPIEPDLDFCKDTLRMLIKYNDRLGVEVAWGLMKEMKVEPDEELEYIVPTFLKEARANA